MRNNQQQPNARIGYTNTLISWGAGIVIIGLMFKINHWPGGQVIVAVGLAAEAVLFFILGIKAMPKQKPGVAGDFGNLYTPNTDIPRLNANDLLSVKNEIARDRERIDRLNAAISVSEGELNIARKMKENGVSYDVISKCTGLNDQDIMSL